MSLNEFTQVQAPVYCDSILTYPSTWGDGGARSRRKRCVNLNWFLNRRGFVPEHNRGAGLQGAGDIVTHHHTQPDHNRLPHDTGHTRHDSHTHTNKPGRRLLSNAKRKTSGAQRIRVFRGKERAKPRLDATPNRRKKTLLYSKWLPAEKGHNSGKRLTCPAAQAKRLAIAGPQQTAGGSWLIQKKKQT